MKYKVEVAGALDYEGLAAEIEKFVNGLPPGRVRGFSTTVARYPSGGWFAFILYVEP